MPELSDIVPVLAHYEENPSIVQNEQTLRFLPLEN